MKPRRITPDLTTPDRQLTYCTTRQAAELLGIAVRTAQLWVDNGILQAWRTHGGHRRISRASVQALLADKRLRAASGGHHQRTLAAQQPPIRILLTDDDEQQRLFRQRIRTWRISVRLITAANGYDALLQIGRESPDLLVANLDTFGMNGLDLLLNLARSSHREGMGIVLISSLTVPEISRHGVLPPEILVIPKAASADAIEAICTSIVEHRAAML
jgi:excisionase family DNA binding protein